MGDVIPIVQVAAMAGLIVPAAIFVRGGISSRRDLDPDRDEDAGLPGARLRGPSPQDHDADAPTMTEAPGRLARGAS